MSTRKRGRVQRAAIAPKSIPDSQNLTVRFDPETGLIDVLAFMPNFGQPGVLHPELGIVDSLHVELINAMSQRSSVG